jgi:hypothetical protein
MRGRGGVVLGIVAGLFAWPSAIAPAGGAAQTPAIVSHAATSAPVGSVAPYVYYGWGSPPSPTTVIQQTEIRQFTLAFMLAKKSTEGAATCTPAWNGHGALTGNAYSRAINQIRTAGGDVSVSFGGAGGPKLGRTCATSSDLAKAYEKVISTFALQSIDVDIEGTEIASRPSRLRELSALADAHSAFPNVYISVTFPSNENGPAASGVALLHEAAAVDFRPNAWTIMPFDFGRPVSNMGKVSIAAVTGLARDVRSAYGGSLATAYERSGISSMNGRTDEKDETVTLQNFRSIVAFANAKHLGRLTFWALNRDRQCTKKSQLSAGA